MIWLTKELRSIIRSFLKYLILARNFSQSSILYVSQTVADNHSFRVRFWYLGFKFFSPFEIKLFFWIQYHNHVPMNSNHWLLLPIIDCYWYDCNLQQRYKRNWFQIRFKRRSLGPSIRLSVTKSSRLIIPPVSRSKLGWYSFTKLVKLSALISLIVSFGENVKVRNE